MSDQYPGPGSRSSEPTLLTVMPLCLSTETARAEDTYTPEKLCGKHVVHLPTPGITHETVFHLLHAEVS